MKSDDRDFYEEHGYLGPLRAVRPEAAEEIHRAFRRELEASHARLSIRRLMPGKLRRSLELMETRNRHLDWPLCAQLCQEKAIVDPLVALLGENLLLWRTQIFQMGGATGLDWHSDEYKTLLSPNDRHISAQIAISAATEANCVWVIPGSHRLSRDELLAHHGLEFVIGSDEDTAFGTAHYRQVKGDPEMRSMLMEPGEVFIFHPETIHRSSLAPEDAAGEKRIGRALRATVPEVTVTDTAFKQIYFRRDRCVVLHGTNEPAINRTASWGASGRTPELQR